jgi:glutamyl-tRNA synthetase
LDSQAEKLLDEAGRKALGALLLRLESVETWTPEALDAAVRRHAEEAGLKLGKIAQPLRAALTGRTTSPGIFDVLEVLGREESLARIRDKVLHSKSA